MAYNAATLTAAAVLSDPRLNALKLKRGNAQETRSCAQQHEPDFRIHIKRHDASGRHGDLSQLNKRRGRAEMREKRQCKDLFFRYLVSLAYLSE
jgi:hypothetical protein